jgi:hypothetical protein
MKHAVTTNAAFVAAMLLALALLAGLLAFIHAG